MNLKLENVLLFVILLTDANRTVWSFDTKCPSLKLVNGRIRYRQRGRSVRFNCFRGFQLVGGKYATCMNGDWDTIVPICVKQGCRAPSSTHINGQFIESYRGAVVKIVCNPGYALLGSPSVYCNGNRWNETFPVCRVTNTNPALSCDFEGEDLCGWTQDPMHDFDWKRQNGSASSGENVTGPTFDHTRGENDTGHYMYLEKFNSRFENDTARLYSPVYPAEYSNGTCFKFWYNMYGPATGVLKVYVKPEGVEFFDLIPSFWVNGEQGTSWSFGFFQIDQLESPFQVVIEGMRGPGAVGDTAFDDVALTSGDECRALEAMTSSTEISTSVISEDETIDLFSCQNRCNETKSDRTTEEDACSCYETCHHDGTCCANYFDVCSVSASSTTAGTTTEQREPSTTEMSSSRMSSTTISQSSPTPPVAINPVPQPSPKNFNNESNEIDASQSLPTKPAGEDKPNRTLNEIPREKTTTTTTMRTTTTTARPKPKTASPVNVTVDASKNVPRRPVKIPKIPEMNLTPNEIPRGEVGRKEVAENASVTSHPAATITRVLKNPKPNNIKLTFMDKPSGSPQPNESWLHNGKSKESGKDTPQAIKIDTKEEKKGVTLRRVVEIGGMSLAVLVVVILGVVWYRRENRKSERENMVEDSDSILYNLDSSTMGSELHSLVGIRPGALQTSADPHLFK